MLKAVDPGMGQTQNRTVVGHPGEEAGHRPVEVDDHVVGHPTRSPRRTETQLRDHARRRDAQRGNGDGRRLSDLHRRDLSLGHLRHDLLPTPHHLYHGLRARLVGARRSLRRGLRREEREPGGLVRRDRGRRLVDVDAIGSQRLTGRAVHLGDDPSVGSDEGRGGDLALHLRQL